MKTPRESALKVLLSPKLEPIVDMVLFSPAADIYEARAVDGFVCFHRRSLAKGWTFEIESVEGRNPLGDQDPSRFASLAAETRTPHPDRTVNSYPFAFEHVGRCSITPVHRTS
jgi:hypothetical protein